MLGLGIIHIPDYGIFMGGRGKFRVQTIHGHKVTETVYKSDTVSVYRATRQNDKKSVLLKILKNVLPSSTQAETLRREYDILSSRHFKGAPTVCSLDHHEDSIYMVLENIRGIPLAELQKEEQLPVDRVLNIGLQLTEILGEIHASNICYLNLSPKSIFINTQSGTLHLIDFSRAITASKNIPDPVYNNYNQGDLSYMAPEQTGRVADIPDLRSDLYSLGIILYELLTSQHPFSTNDPLELVHAHIAMPPTSPDALNPNIPKALSQIVMKLLAKAPNERYQTCGGLRSDLNFCLEQIKDKDGSKNGFYPGINDHRSQFHFPDVLFGRDSDFEKLKEHCTNIRNKPACFTLISGPSGIGKSSLVYNLHRPLNEKGLTFLSGDIDQFHSNIPYSPLIKAFQELARLILTGDSEDIKQWRTTILEAVSPNGQVLIDMLPELELIIGRQEPVPALPPAETENRFNITLRRFIRACASTERPVILFLDNFQRAEQTTLKLLETFLTDPSMANLMVLGCFRDNEVNEEHPLSQLIDRLQNNGMEVKQMSLTPLGVKSISLLLASLLHFGPSITEPLAGICYHKTRGNPFFLKQFLFSLVNSGLLFFDRKKSAWQWDIKSIRQVEVTDNAATFMSQRIRTLSPDIRDILQHAACFGPLFTNRELAIICDRPIANIQKAIEEALIEGFLVLAKRKSNSTAIYKFSHDQVESAVYRQLSEKGRKSHHLHIGRLILCDELPIEESQRLFAIAEQLNKGSGLIIEVEERLNLAEINLSAGRKAKLSAAFEPAYKYLQAGLDLLSAQTWSTHYQLTLSLHIEGAEAAYLTGSFDKTHTLFAAVLENAQTLLDKVRIYEIVINSFKAQNKLGQAVETGLHVLTLLGVKLPARPSKLSMLPVLLSIKALLRGKKPEDLVNLPSMTDPHYLAVMSIIESIGTAAYYTVPELLPMIGFKAVQLSLRHGNTDQSTVMGYPTYGFLQCGVIGDIDIGYRFGQVALDIQKHLHNGQTNPRTQYLVANLISHWKDHIADSIPILKDAGERALTNGELEAAANAAYAISYRLFLLGRNLLDVKRNIDESREKLETLGQQIPLTRLAIFQQAVDNLIHPGSNPVVLEGPYFSEKTTLTEYAGDQTTIFLIHQVKMILAYLLQRYDTAAACATEAEKYLHSVVSSVFIPCFTFYDSLIKLAIVDKVTYSQKKKYMHVVQTNLKKLKKWSRHAPANYLHKTYLVQAEQERVTGSESKALELYSKAAQTARENKYPQEEALAYELAAGYAADRELKHLGNSFIREARNGYEQWGAVTKIKQLDAKAPQKFKDKFESDIVVGPDFFLNQRFQLDMMTVVKTSRSLAGEIVLDEFMKKLMRIMIENAGAQKGFLLFEENGNWQVRVEGHTENERIEVQREESTTKQHELSMMVVNYVARTSANIVLRDACNEGLFIHDRYMVENRIKSVFCMPITHQENISCIVYLENNLNTGVFSPDREELLHHLGIQAAISLHNSSLYSRLEDTLQKIHKEHLGMTFAICKMAESRDPETGEHLERMREYCRVIAMYLQQKKKYRTIITDEYIEHIYVASALHDIGKIGVPDSILQKPGKLTSAEFEIMKSHTTIGQKSLMEVDRLYPGNDFISMGMEIAATHHEKWDGSGYPDGLKGTAIPLASRILAISDVYDTLTSRRVYKEPLSHEKSCNIIQKGRGSHFDPEIVDAFNDMQHEFIKIKETFRDTDEAIRQQMHCLPDQLP